MKLKIPKEAQKPLLAFAALCVMFFYGLFIGGFFGLYHEYLTKKLLLLFLTIVAASFTIVLIYLVPKSCRHNIKESLFSLSVVSILFILMFGFLTNQTNTMYSHKKTDTFQKEEIQYQKKIEKLTQDLETSSQLFLVLSIFPKNIDKDFIEYQIKQNQKILLEIQTTIPPKQTSLQHLKLYRIAMIQFDNLIKYKNHEYYETIFSNAHIKNTYQEDWIYLKYGNCGKIKRI